MARCKLVVLRARRGDRLVGPGAARADLPQPPVECDPIRRGTTRLTVVVDADQDFATLQVRDHGVGIAPDQQARIFERFERGVEQRSGGFGIGLWVVKNICVAMGGTIAVESEPGEGARFTVMLPRRNERGVRQRPIGGNVGGRQRNAVERRPTGVPGLDRILEGGLLVSGVYIVQGPPGAGKTILANQMCFHHASTGGHAVYVTLLAESHSRMFAHLRRMAFFDESRHPGPRVLHRRLQHPRNPGGWTRW